MIEIRDVEFYDRYSGIALLVMPNGRDVAIQWRTLAGGLKIWESDSRSNNRVSRNKAIRDVVRCAILETFGDLVAE